MYLNLLDSQQGDTSLVLYTSWLVDANNHDIQSLSSIKSWKTTTSFAYLKHPRGALISISLSFRCCNRAATNIDFMDTIDVLDVIYGYF